MDKEKNNVTLSELKSLESTSDKLAREIRMLSRGIKKLASGGLKKETVVLLIHDSSNVGKVDIRAVLFALENLEKKYCEQEAKSS